VPIARLRSFTGPAILSYGFRPFFLFGAFYAGLALLMWLPMFEGRFELATSFSPMDWHIHEMLYGYIAAVVTGFLLTAIPNWTGRLPLNGMPLLVLVAVWAAGRLAVAYSAVIGWAPAALIDVVFLMLVLAAAGREIVAGENWRNLRVLAIVAVFTLANVTFHIEAHVQGETPYSQRLSLSAVILLVMLVGGRIVPSFTHNWLVRENPGRLPTSFDRFDAISIAVGALALVAWTAAPDSLVAGLLLIGAGLLNAARLVRWAGNRTVRDPLVLILHVAYAFVPLGFVLAGVTAVGADIPPSAGVHAWSVGAIGTMTLAVMTRATRGHTGRALEAPPSTQLLYAAVILSAVLRILAALLPSLSQPLLWAAVVAWVAAFWGFCGVYGPMILRPRLISQEAAR
jgi:uncharacterized protein involved in response to NO